MHRRLADGSRLRQCLTPSDHLARIRPSRGQRARLRTRQPASSRLLLKNYWAEAERILWVTTVFAKSHGGHSGVVEILTERASACRRSGSYMRTSTLLSIETRTGPSLTASGPWQ